MFAAMKYDDIIKRERPMHEGFPRVSREVRASQLSSFAALTGFDDIIDETERFTDDDEELWVDKIMEINTLLIRMMLDSSLEAIVTWFTPDKTKAGGSYRNATGTLAKYDEVNGTIELSCGATIPIDDISDIVIM